MQDFDRRIWESELDGFVPHRIFDVHSHIWRAEDYLGPPADQPAAWFTQAGHTADLAGLRTWHRRLLPGRELHYLAFPSVSAPMPAQPTPPR